MESSANFLYCLMQNALDTVIVGIILYYRFYCDINRVNKTIFQLKMCLYLCHIFKYISILRK